MRTLEGPRAGWAALLVTLLGAAFWLACSPLEANDVVGGDEGYYGTMARNVLAAPRWLVSPSLTPLGPPGDKPPAYPAILAAFVALLGPTASALRWPTVIAAVCVALGIAALVRRAAGGWAGVAAAALLVALPAFADAARVAAAEIPLAAFGVGALVALAPEPRAPRRAAAAGALLGLAFLCKFWLVFPFALAALSMVGRPARATARAHGALVATAIAVGGLQLAAVALARPHELRHWLGILWSFSLASRLSGEGYDASWIHPRGYYAGHLAHALAIVLPAAALGLHAAIARWREPVPRALAIWALGIAVLACFRVQSGVYANVVLPAWVALAALGAATLAREGSGMPWLVVAFALASAPWLGRTLGLEAAPPVVWAGVWAAWLAASVLAARRASWARAAAVAVVAFALVLGAGRIATRLPLRYHDPGYRAIAAVAAPWLRDAAPQDVTLVAPEAPAFGYLLFRTARYWGTPRAPWTQAEWPALADPAGPRVFIVDPARALYGGWPDSTTVRRLETTMTERTAEVERAAGRTIALRVFVRHSSSHAGDAESGPVD